MWRTRAIASAVALGWLGLVGRWLLGAAPVSGQVEVAPMELVWLAPAPPPPARTPARSVRRTPHRARAAAPVRLAPATTLQAVTLPERAAANTPASTQALVTQARAWADAQATAPARDPWADRTTHLPGRTTDRFAMREPPSVAGALAKVGKLFGGAGYQPDPCPRRRENVTALLAAGDSAQLRHEMDFVQRKCNP
jgi:hypothetical protein